MDEEERRLHQRRIRGRRERLEDVGQQLGFKKADILAGAEIIGGLNTIVLIVDTQSLPEVPHWQHVARIWQSRLRLSAREVWAIYHMRPQECGLQAVSYYWAGTFVLEAFQLLAPQFNYILIDSDAIFIGYTNDVWISQFSFSCFGVAHEREGLLVLP